MRTRYCGGTSAGCGTSRLTGPGSPRWRGLYRAGAGPKSSPVRHEQAAQARAPADSPGHRPPGRPPGEGESAVGTPPDPRRTGKARRDRRAVHDVGDPACLGHRSGTATLGSELAAVPARPGCRDRRGRFPARGHRAAEAHICAGVHRTWHPPDAHPRVTASPTGDWTVQQARNLALGLGEHFEDIKFLIRDRGTNFTASFDAVFPAAGTRILRTAVQAPRMNATCERLVGTPRAPRPHANSR